MSAVEAATQVVISAAKDANPERRSSSALYLDRLRLHVRVKELQAQESPAGALFVGEVTAAVGESAPGITITCVGIAESLSAAAENAVGQWVAGVFPVLTAWRGEHTCLVEREPRDFGGTRFDVMAGPQLARGSDADPESHSPPQILFDAVTPELERMRLAPRIHWIELYTGKSPDGSINATCRLNNRDWMPGQRVLEQVAAPWEAIPFGLRTSRQFAMLSPTGATDGELKPISLWDRLRNRA